jgi:hypothetical protein
MKTMTALVLAALLAIPAGASAQEYVWDTPWSEYGQRTDSVTIGAGNAKEANSAIHAVDPRPPSSRNRNIPANGERMFRVIRRYQDLTKLQEAAPMITGGASVGGSGSSGSSSSSSGSSSSGK